jgi:hypothetical protein
MFNSVLFCDLQRPLTVKDYLKNSLISPPTDIVTGVGAGVGSSVGHCHKLAVAVAAQPRPQT